MDCKNWPSSISRESSLPQASPRVTAYWRRSARHNQKVHALFISISNVRYHQVSDGFSFGGAISKEFDSYKDRLNELEGDCIRVSGTTDKHYST